MRYALCLRTSFDFHFVFFLFLELRMQMVLQLLRRSFANRIKLMVASLFFVSVRQRATLTIMCENNAELPFEKYHSLHNNNN